MSLSIEGMSVATLEKLPYVTLLAHLGESNRPPGGIDTIRRLILNCHIRQGHFILHAGCNAGFSSREIVRLTGCSAVGVDISPDMAHKADQIAHEQFLQDRLRYQQADMRRLPFNDQQFDVTFSAGALAFVDGHRAAVDQWIRVTRPYGLLADAEMYYRSTPPPELRSRVAEIIGIDVPSHGASYWMDLFSGPLLEPYYDFDAPIKTRNDDDVVEYVRRLVQHKAGRIADEARAFLEERLIETFRIFNENLGYMSYKIVVRRRLPDNAEPALYV